VRLFPPAELRDHGSGRLQPSDDLWKLTAVNPPRSITLVNGRSGQEIVLAPDHVHHFTSSSPADTSCAGTLELTMRVDLTGEVPTISPIPSGPARVNAVTLHPSPAEVRRSWFAEHPSQVFLGVAISIVIAGGVAWKINDAQQAAALAKERRETAAQLEKEKRDAAAQREKETREAKEAVIKAISSGSHQIGSFLLNVQLHPERIDEEFAAHERNMTRIGDEMMKSNTALGQRDPAAADRMHVGPIRQLTETDTCLTAIYGRGGERRLHDLVEMRRRYLAAMADIATLLPAIADGRAVPKDFVVPC